MSATFDDPTVSAVSAPIIVSWNLTRLCNLACGHCYLDAVSRRREAPDELSTGEAMGVIAQLAELAPGAMLVLTGGEPLLRRDLVTLVRVAAQQRLMPVIGTNGTLLTRERACALKDAGAMGVGVSLDSADPVFHDRLRGQAGAWARALLGIQAARAAGLSLLLQCTVFEENRDDLAALAELAEVHGAMAFNVFFLVCTGRGVTQTDLAPQTYERTLVQIIRLQHEHPRLKVRARCAPYLRRLQGLRAGDVSDGFADWSSACLAGRQYFRITPQGEVTPCPYIPQPVGDLRAQPLRAIWNTHPLLRRLRTEMPGGKCGACDYRVSCGGCRARAYAAGGDVMAADPKCVYVPPVSVQPEVFGQTGIAPAELVWSPDAAARLERIPAFLRDMVRKRLEALAQEKGVGTITAEFVRAHRPTHLAGAADESLSP